MLGTVPDAGGLGYRVLVPPGVHGRLEPRGRSRPTYPGDDVLAAVAGTAVHVAWPVRRARRWRAAATTEPLLTGQRVLDALFPGRARQQRRGARRLRHRQDHAAAAGRQVVRRGRHRLRRLRGARQRDGRRARRARSARRPAHRAAAGRAHGDHRQHLEHADDGPRGQHLHRGDGRRVLPRHGPPRRGHRRFDLPLGRGAAGVLVPDPARCRPRRATRPPCVRRWPRSTNGRPGGPCGGQDGSVTIIGAVSPPGGDITEPVTTHTQRLVRACGTWTANSPTRGTTRRSAGTARSPATSDSFARWYARNGDLDWARAAPG